MKTFKTRREADGRYPAQTWHDVIRFSPSSIMPDSWQGKDAPSQYHAFYEPHNRG